MNGKLLGVKLGGNPNRKQDTKKSLIPNLGKVKSSNFSKNKFETPP